LALKKRLKPSQRKEFHRSSTRGARVLKKKNRRPRVGGSRVKKKNLTNEGSEVQPMLKRVSDGTDAIRQGASIRRKKRDQ